MRARVSADDAYAVFTAFGIDSRELPPSRLGRTARDNTKARQVRYTLCRKKYSIL